MSEHEDDVVTGPGVKTLAVRFEPELRAQLELIAQLTGNTLAREVRLAVMRHITVMKNDPIVLSRAERAIKDIDVEAAKQRQTIATLFGEDGKNTGTSAKPGRTRTRKGTEPANPA